MTTAVVDYGSGNLASARKAFQRMSDEVDGGPIVVTADPDVVSRADRVVLPGVGAFADCRTGLMAVDGMADAVSARVAAGQPFFGICVGMQLIATRGLEHGTTPGLDWIAGEVVRLEPGDPTLKVPHMGWNDLACRRSHPVLDGLQAGAHAYFVHSYHYRLDDPSHCLAEVDYGGNVAAVIGRDNLIGTQFHPEKSQATGLRMIGNFLKWRP